MVTSSVSKLLAEKTDCTSTWNSYESGRISKLCVNFLQNKLGQSTFARIWKTATIFLKRQQQQGWCSTPLTQFPSKFSWKKRDSTMTMYFLKKSSFTSPHWKLIFIVKYVRLIINFSPECYQWFWSVISVGNYESD